MLKILELFGGIGACSKALERLGIDYEIADYVEIDKYAVKSFNAIHNTNFEPQDICKWDKDIEVDLIMHGSPCQSFSLAGKQEGGDKGSGTRSSLMWETIRIVEKLKPKYVIWENVKNLLSKKHRHNFDAYLETMEQLGYTNYYQVLNAKDYGIPQNRERVFTVSILGNEKKYDFPKGNECNNKIDVVGNYMPSGHDASRIVDENGLAPTVKENHGTVTAVLQRFEFPPKQELKLKLKDMLEDEVDEKYYLSDKQLTYVLDMRDVALSSGRNINERIVNPQIAKTISCRGATDQRADVTNFTIDGCDEEIKVKNVKLRIKEATKQGCKEASGGTKLQREMCNKAIEKNLVEPNDVIEYTYSNARLKEMDNNTIKKQNKADNQIMSTLVTKPDKLGVVVKSVYSDLEEQLFTEDGNIKRYIDSDIVDEFKEGQMATTSFPNGYGHGPRTHDESICLNCIDKPSVKQNLRIRKLTPKECWRLMGFDDEDFEKASKVNSNTQLYKQAGNSIVVNVLEAIFKELIK